MAKKKTDNKDDSSKKTSKQRLTKEDKEKAKLIEEEEKERLHKKKLFKTELIAIVIIAIGVFFVLSNHTNACGSVGISVSNFLKGCLGTVAYILPFYMIVLGILIFAQRTALFSWKLSVCSIIFFILLSSLFAAHSAPLNALGESEAVINSETLKAAYATNTGFGGGVIGYLFAAFMLNTIGSVGLHIVSIVGMIIALIFVIDTPISQFFDNWKIKREAKKLAKEKYLEEKAKADAEEKLRIEEQRKIDEQKALEAENTEDSNKVEVGDDSLPTLNTDAIQNFEEDNSESRIVDYDEDLEKKTDKLEVRREYEGEDITENKRQILDYVSNGIFSEDDVPQSEGTGLDPYKQDILEKYGTIIPNTKESDEIGDQIKSTLNEDSSSKETTTTSKSYKMPPISLLKKGNFNKNSNSSGLNDQAHLIEETLHSFGVNASVTNVVKGPSVTRYEVTPAPGVQVSKITKLKDDIALNLRATSLRVEAPIPGKAAVGIEVSNDTTSVVSLRDLIESKEFKNHKSKIAVTLGKSISGENIICDLHDMPHLLIAGTTGSGKSVCIDSMLISLLYKARPDEVKLILIDPKIVELTPFNGIPHLAIPVVTEPNKAAVALAWAVGEMNNRYNMFAEEGVKDLQSYNESVKFKGEDDKIMPEMVIVIDELADLMMAAKNQVEDSICRLAQKARAAGMHLLIATQRPSVDVITGVIKANVPSRIGLAVSSGVDSRTILDMTGAENLLGKGDMLYSPQSLSKPIRVQGTYISDEEMHAVVDFVKKQANPDQVNEDLLNAMDKVGSNNVSGNEKDDGGDELFMDALETVVKAEQCSVSMLQRRFRIGYNRAARLVDMMEERGMVGPQDGARPRKVNMTMEEFDEYVARNKELEGEL